MSAGLMLGPYRVPSFEVAAHYRLTNKTPAATYRSPGRYETTFVRERMMDAIAHKVGIDPVETRRRNLLGREEMPYARPLDALGVQVILDSGDYAGLLEKTLARVQSSQLQARMAQRRAAGEIVGVGLAMFVEKSGLGPSDGVRITVDTTGCVELVTGAGSVGQGMETVLAQICSDTLGVDYRKVRVIHGRTERMEFGNGAHASRVTVMSGSATQVAALKVRRKALDIAGRLLHCPSDALQIEDGRVYAPNDPAVGSLDLGEITVQDFGKAGQSFLVRFNTVKNVGGIGPKLEMSLTKAYGPGVAKVVRVESVGAKVGSDLRRKGFFAVVIATIFMGVYIAIQFRNVSWSFGAGAVIALIHDVLVVMLALVISQYQFDLTTLAAVLTVIGYSVHDTIIVSDRIREDSTKRRREPIAQIMNRAINETLSRTILTSGTAIVVLISLLAFGGPILRPSAFTLLVGFITGTYSSIYIAGPVVLFWEGNAKLGTVSSRAA